MTKRISTSFIKTTKRQNASEESGAFCFGEGYFDVGVVSESPIIFSCLLIYRYRPICLSDFYKNNNAVNNNDLTSNYEETFVNTLTYFTYYVKLLT